MVNGQNLLFFRSLLACFFALVFFFFYLPYHHIKLPSWLRRRRKKRTLKGTHDGQLFLFFLSFFILSIYVQLFNWWEYPINTSYCLARPLDRLICNEKKANSNSFNLLIIQSDPNKNSFASKFGNQNNCKQSQITVN